MNPSALRVRVRVCVTYSPVRESARVCVGVCKCVTVCMRACVRVCACVTDVQDVARLLYGRRHEAQLDAADARRRWKEPANARTSL